MDQTPNYINLKPDQSDQFGPCYGTQPPKSVLGKRTRQNEPLDFFGNYPDFGQMHRQKIRHALEDKPPPMTAANQPRERVAEGSSNQDSYVNNELPGFKPFVQPELAPLPPIVPLPPDFVSEDSNQPGLNSQTLTINGRGSRLGEPSKNQPENSEEVVKQVKLLKNRKAASRCREKKKEEYNRVQRNYQKLKHWNNGVQKQLATVTQQLYQRNEENTRLRCQLKVEARINRCNEEYKSLLAQISKSLNNLESRLQPTTRSHRVGQSDSSPFTTQSPPEDKFGSSKGSGSGGTQSQHRDKLHVPQMIASSSQPITKDRMDIMVPVSNGQSYGMTRPQQPQPQPQAQQLLPTYHEAMQTLSRPEQLSNYNIGNQGHLFMRASESLQDQFAYRTNY